MGLAGRSQLAIRPTAFADSGCFWLPRELWSLDRLWPRTAEVAKVGQAAPSAMISRKKSWRMQEIRLYWPHEERLLRTHGAR